MRRLYVQYGCGQCSPDGWLNFDASPTLLIEKLTRRRRVFAPSVRYGDIVRGLPVKPESADVVYCSHILEHLALADFRAALRNTYKILKPGGTFRLVLPDLEWDIHQYLKRTETDAAPIFMSNTHLGHKTRDRGIRGLLVAWLGNSRHLWMWDYKAIHVELVNAGFVDIRRARLGDNPDPAFRSVENPPQWGWNLGVECKRPH